MTPTDQHGGWSDGTSSGLDGEGRGRFGGLLSRIFENPDNPLGWSVKVFSLWGIAVRVHLFTFLFVGVMLVRSIRLSNEGWIYSSLAMAMLLLVILLHEFGHCIACRRAGGTADRVVLLPFGGLALVRPPHHWRAHLISTVGGPAVNLAIVPMTVIALWLLGMGEHIVFNPLAWMDVLAQIQGRTNAEAIFKIAVWILHAVNLVILGFNVLIPAYPLDGGRIVQALAWRKMGYNAGTELAVTIGLGASMILLVMGIAINQVLLAVIAGFAVWSCWAERQRVRGEREITTESYGIGGAPDLEDAQEADPWAQRQAQKREQAQQREQAKVDRVLAKIADGGIDSLTKSERRVLEAETKRKQQRG